MKHSAGLISATLFAVAAATTPIASASDEFALEGNYVQASDQTAIVDKAIDGVVSDMNMFKRPIARGRLQKTNPIYQRIHLERTPKAFVVQFDARKPIQMPLDGTAIKWVREDGDKFDVAATLYEGRLVQTYKSEEGSRSNTFRWDPVSKRLYLDVMLTSPKLPQPLKYMLTYRREE